MSEPAAIYYYPNILGRIIFQAMQEILGQNGLNAVLNQSGLSQLINNFPPNNLDRDIPFDHISRIMSALEEVYGERGGQGLAIRSGRACFKYGMREFGQMNGLSDQEFRLLPLNNKIREGAKKIARIFNDYCDQHVQVDEDENYFFWHMEPCPICWERRTENPVCHIAVGTIQEALFWVSGGKFFNVKETHCIARGDPTCTISVDKVPFE